MPDLELKPDDYRVQTKRGGWINRDDFKMTIPYAGAVALGFIVYAWWNRAELPLVALVGVVAVSSFLFGILIGAWLKRFG